MDLELEWTMGAQRLAQRGPHSGAGFCDDLDSHKMGVFSRGNFLTGGRSGRSMYPAEAISRFPAFWSRKLNWRNQAIALIDLRGGIGWVAGVLHSGSPETLVLCHLKNARASDAEAVSYHRKCTDLLRQSRRVAGLRSPRQCHDGEAQPCILATRHRTCSSQLTLSGVNAHWGVLRWDEKVDPQSRIALS